MQRWLSTGVAVVAIVLLGSTARRYVHGFTLVVRAADLHGSIRRLAEVDAVPIRERIVRARGHDASLRARVYAPIGIARQTVLLVPGLHPVGIDEPRFMTLARRLAEANITVVTPELPELVRFEIAPILTDRIEGAAAWLATESGLAPAGRIGLMGISFSGGLAVVAAGRESLRNHLLYVFSFGGHDDVRRLLEYFCTGVEGEGAIPEDVPAPHDYGVAIVLLNVADRMVPPNQIEPLRDGVRRFLWASYLDRVNKSEAEREFGELRELARHLPEPAATLLQHVNNRDVARLGPQLLPHLGFYMTEPALSPSRSPAPHAPVFLLHGRDDNVIPAVESQHLADRLRGRVPVQLLLTRLISHAETDQTVHVTDVMELVGFWGDLLDR